MVKWGTRRSAVFLAVASIIIDLYYLRPHVCLTVLELQSLQHSNMVIAKIEKSKIVEHFIRITILSVEN
jgi:hypothetical protein